MQKYDEERIILAAGEHAIYLPKESCVPAYKLALDDVRTTDNINVIIPKVMLSTKMHLNKFDYDLYVNTEDVIVEEAKLGENEPGITLKEFEENQVVVMESYTHEVRLPYREGVMNNDSESSEYGQLEEIFHSYEGYEAISPESNCEYPLGRFLWDDGDVPYVTYKIYRNNVSVAILAKDLDKDVPGKVLVKKCL